LVGINYTGKWNFNNYLFILGGNITYLKPRRNENGGVRDKYSYCYFCGKKIAARIPFHLARRHENEKEVMKMLLLTNKEAKKAAAQYLKNLGNNQHNAEVIAKGEGELILARAPADESKFDHSDYTPCNLCFCWYKKCELSRHLCPRYASDKKRPSLRASKTIKNMMEANVNEGMATVLAGMYNDAIGRVTKADYLLLQWLEPKVKTGPWKEKTWQTNIRSRMRLGGRLLLELRKKYANASLFAMLTVDKFDDLVVAAKGCSTLSEGKEAMFRLVYIDHLVTALIKLKSYLALKAKDKDTVSEMVQLNNLWDQKKEKQRNEEDHSMTVEDIATTEDTDTNAQHLKKQLLDALSAFKNSKTYSNYRQLQKSAMARICHFNRNKGGNVSEELITDVQKAKQMEIDTSDKIFNCLAPEEKKAANAQKLIVLHVKKDRNSPCILDAPMEKALDLLIEFRKLADLHPENKFVFAVHKAKNSSLDPGQVKAKCVKGAAAGSMAVRGIGKIRKCTENNQNVGSRYIPTGS